MQKYVLLFIAFITTFSQQNKIDKVLLDSKEDSFNVWIFLKDKNNSIPKALSSKQVELRQTNQIDSKDIPLTESYVSQISDKVIRVRHQLKWFNAITVTATKKQIQEIAKFNFVSKIDGVKKLKRKIVSYTDEMNQSQSRLRSSQVINYGASAPQYNLINVPEVHDLGYTGKNVIVGVFDSGFNNLNHESLSPLDIQLTWDFVSNNSSVDDSGYSTGEGNHGTQTLSCMAGYMPGDLVGPAFKSTFLLAKTEYGPTETTQEEDNYVAALEWAEANGAWIVSSSLGYRDFDNSSDSYSWQDFDGNTAISTKAADIAASKGILVITSAGNSGDGTNNTLGAPADGDSVLAVGATNSSGSRVSFSSVGPSADGRVKPDVMAQGSSVRVASPSNDGSYNLVNGTSFSCPITAGSAALLFEANPLATNMEILNILRTTANNASSPDKYNGYGVINVFEAFNQIKLIHHTPVTNSPNPSSPITINAQIKNGFTSRYSSFTLNYKLSTSNNYSSVNFSQGSVGSEFTSYTATIPAQGSGTINYYLSVTNGNRTANVPPNYDSTPYSINVGSGSNNPPTLNTISDINLQENASEQSVSLTGISDGDNGNQTLTISTTSSNTTLIPTPNVTYTQGSSTGTLVFTPVQDQTGTSTITVIVQDDGSTNNSVQQTFTITVSSGNTDYEPNNSFSEAKAIPTNQLISSFIQTDGDEDYFTFTLPKSGTLDITLANFPGDYDFFLYNSSQSEVARAYTTKDPETVNYNATVGTYYIKIDGYRSAYSSTDDYELTINYTPDVGFEDWVLANQVIESAHNYSNYTNDTKTYTHVGALKVGVHFSTFDTETNYDFIHIKDKNGTTVNTYHGSLDPFWAIVDGDEININLVSDYSVTKYGYKIDQVGYFTGTTFNIINSNSLLKSTIRNLTQLEQKKSVEIDPFASKHENSIIPTEYSVSEPYPNPFNPTTHIKIDLVEETFLTVDIINSLGQKVKNIYTGRLAAGSKHPFSWDSTNSKGNKVSSGIYFFRVTYNNNQIIKRTVLLK